MKKNEVLNVKNPKDVRTNKKNEKLKMDDVCHLSFEEKMKYDNIAVPVSYVSKILKIDANTVRLNMITGVWELGIVCYKSDRNKYIIMSHRLYEQLGIMYPKAIKVRNYDE